MTDTAPSGDELAGVVDLFGALRRPELRRAVREAQFRAGGRDADDTEGDDLAATIDEAVATYQLVACDRGDLRGDLEDDGTAGGDGGGGTGHRDGDGGDDASADGDAELLAVGPTAFPELPPGAEDLPHIVSVEPREPDRERLATTVARRFRAETARAVDRGDRDRIGLLLDVSYDLETWGPVDCSTMRDRLDRALADDADATTRSRDPGTESAERNDDGNGAGR